MNDIQSIEAIIKKIPRQKIFFAASIAGEYPIKDIKQALKRLIKKREVGTISHNMYFRPKINRYMPDILIPPSTEQIIKSIAKITGEVITIHAANALNLVGLSTQIPMRAIYFTTGRTRYIKINGQDRIKLVHINSKKIIMPGTLTCIVATALWNIGKEHTTPITIKKIHNRIENENFKEVLQNLNQMPTWMKKIFVRYQNMAPDNPELQDDPDEYWQG